jgi:hypothetical protein
VYRFAVNVYASSANTGEYTHHGNASSRRLSRLSGTAGRGLERPDPDRAQSPRVQCPATEHRLGFANSNRGRGRYRHRNRSPTRTTPSQPPRGGGDRHLCEHAPTGQRNEAHSCGIPAFHRGRGRYRHRNRSPTRTTPSQPPPGRWGQAPLRRRSCALAVQHAPTGQRNGAQGCGVHAATLGLDVHPSSPTPTGLRRQATAGGEFRNPVAIPRMRGTFAGATIR